MKTIIAGMGEDDNLEAYGDLLYTLCRAFDLFGWHWTRIESNARVKDVFDNRKIVKDASGNVLSEVTLIETMFDIDWVINDTIESNYLYLKDSMSHETCRIGKTSQLVIEPEKPKFRDLEKLASDRLKWFGNIGGIKK